LPALVGWSLWRVWPPVPSPCCAHAGVRLYRADHEAALGGEELLIA